MYIHITDYKDKDKFYCPECDSLLEFNDTTYSNIDTIRANIGQKTGDIYFCNKCESFWIDDYLDGKFKSWSY